MKAVSRAFVLSLTTLALTVACVEDKKKSEARKQDPKAAPAQTAGGGGGANSPVVEEALKAARGKAATPEELANLVGNWQVTTIPGEDPNLNPLTAGAELRLPQTKTVIQVQIEKERIKILHLDGELTFFRADLPMKVNGKLIESTDTQTLALPALEFALTGKDKLTLKAYGWLSTPAKRLRQGTPANSANETVAPAKQEDRLYTYELSRVTDAEVAKPTENSVKMDYKLNAPNAHLTSSLSGKAAPTAEQKGRLSCRLVKTSAGQGLSINYNQRENESAQALTPAHGLHLKGNVNFDFNKESEETSMALAAEAGKENFIGQIDKSGQRLKLLMKDAQSCTVAMSRKNRAITFSLKCTDLTVGEEKTTTAAAQTGAAPAEQKAEVSVKPATAAKATDRAETSELDPASNIDLDADLAKVMTAKADANGTKADATGTKTETAATANAGAKPTNGATGTITNARPSEIIFATGSCHLQAGRPL